MDKKKKKKFFVIGDSTKKSLSPFIFKHWFKIYNINATYTYKQIKTKNFNNEIKKIINTKEACGANITIPFKRDVIKYLQSTDSHSKKIGAVNCISKNKKNWKGYNTDWRGFNESTKKTISKKTTKTAAVIGYGGAAKAIIYALQKDGFKKIKVFNRSFEKIEHLKNKKNLIPKPLKELRKEIANADLLINTTPTNVFKNKTLTKKINSSMLVCDIVYKPKSTKFLNLFKNQKKIYGISMLVYQAAYSFKIWFGIYPVVDKALFAILNKKI